MIYTASTYADAANTLSVPSWTRFDAGARYETKVSGKPVIFRLNVENLFDKDYWGTATAGYLLVGAPRTITLSASVGFYGRPICPRTPGPGYTTGDTWSAQSSCFCPALPAFP